MWPPVFSSGPLLYQSSRLHPYTATTKAQSHSPVTFVWRPVDHNVVLSCFWSCEIYSQPKHRSKSVRKTIRESICGDTDAMYQFMKLN